MYLIPAYITLFFIYGIIPPYLSILLSGLGYSTSVVGILLAVSEGAGIAGPFLFGHFADKTGKYKPGIILSYLLTAAGAIPLALFVHPVVSALFIALLAFGFRAALPLVESMATLNLGREGNYGRLRMTGSISFICFLFFLQWIPVLKPETPFNIAAWIVLSVAAAAIAVLVLPSRYSSFSSRQNEAPKGMSAAKEDSAARRKIWTPVFTLGFFMIFLSRLAMTPINSFLSLYLVDYIHWDAVGFMWALASVMEIPFMFISYRLIRRFKTLPLLALTSAAVAIRLALYVIFPFKAGVIAAQLLHSLCYGLFHPVAVTFISENVAPEQRAYGMTLYISLGLGLPTLIGSFIGGFIVDHVGYSFLFGSFTVFAILGTALLPIFRVKKV
jgi:PPP family 3-phenylpropionic acid transporter